MISRSLLPAHLSHLDAPSIDARAHSERLRDLISNEIARHDGWITFARYMELALHTPGLGYYSAGASKIGAGGDFVTAPEMGELFARTFARQLTPLIRAGLTDLLELGAGSGSLACSLLNELAALSSLPQRYLILETSADLRQRQQQMLARRVPHHLHRISWLDTLPTSLEAVAIGNEVLDAMPVHVIAVDDGRIDERGVTFEGLEFRWSNRPAGGSLRAAARELLLPAGYFTEINLAARSFVHTLGKSLARGVLMLID